MRPASSAGPRSVSPGSRWPAPCPSTTRAWDVRRTTPLPRSRDLGLAPAGDRRHPDHRPRNRPGPVGRGRPARGRRLGPGPSARLGGCRHRERSRRDSRDDGQPAGRPGRADRRRPARAGGARDRSGHDRWSRVVVHPGQCPGDPGDLRAVRPAGRPCRRWLAPAGQPAHAALRTFADDPARHDPVDSRGADRGRSGQRRARRRARRWRTGHRADLHRADRRGEPRGSSPVRRSCSTRCTWIRTCGTCRWAASGSLQKARAAGAPIKGVTISAGIPDKAEALALLDELAEAGIWLNAFKPGTVAQVAGGPGDRRGHPAHALDPPGGRRRRRATTRGRTSTSCCCPPTT